MKTTLNKIREHSPCTNGWTKLLNNLGKIKADDEPISISYILDSNGLDDALWCLRAIDGYQKEMRLYAVDCARSVQHLTTDQRSIDAIDVAERHAHGQATDAELNAARAAASAAAWTARAAGWAAASAARDAASSARAAGTAAGDAAREVQADLLRIVCAEIEGREE